MDSWLRFVFVHRVAARSYGVATFYNVPCLVGIHQMIEQPLGPGDPAYLTRKVCFYCHKDEIAHVDAHCPFDSTVFRAMTEDEYWQYLRSSGVGVTSIGYSVGVRRK